MTSNRGGKRKGAGRHRISPELKKNPVSIKLPQWLIEWTNDQPMSRAELIEQALCKVHKLNPPIK